MLLLASLIYECVFIYFIYVYIYIYIYICLQRIHRYSKVYVTFIIGSVYIRGVKGTRD